MQRHLCLFLTFILLFFCKNIHSSSSVLNDLSLWHKTVNNTQVSKNSDPVHNKESLESVNSLVHLLSIIISFLGKKSAIKRNIPKDIQNIITQYTVVAFDNCEKKQWQNEVMHGSYEQRFLFDKYFHSPPLGETIDAYELKNISYYACEARYLSIFIKNVYYTDIMLDRCIIYSLKIQHGSLGTLTIKDSYIARVTLKNITLHRSLCFKRNIFDSFELYAKKHEGGTIKDKQVVFNQCTITNNFVFDSLKNFAPYYSDYGVVAINSNFSLASNIDVGDNLNILRCGSRFLNSPDFENTFNDHKVDCLCHGCCSCMYGYCRLTIDTLYKIACEDYNCRICHEKCCFSEGVKRNINSCCTSFLECFVCSLGVICCPLLALPKVSKDYLKFCCTYY